MCVLIECNSASIFNDFSNLCVFCLIYVQFQYAPQHLVRLLQIIVIITVIWECDK